MLPYGNRKLMKFHRLVAKESFTYYQWYARSLNNKLFSRTNCSAVFSVTYPSPTTKLCEEEKYYTSSTNIPQLLLQ